MVQKENGKGRDGRWFRVWNWICAVSAILARLTFRVIEGGTILATFFVAIYVGYWLLFGATNSPRYQRVTTFLRTIDENWKAVAALLLTLLFYRTVRTFVDELQEFAGAKRRSTQPIERTPQEPNPTESARP